MSAAAEWQLTRIAWPTTTALTLPWWHLRPAETAGERIVPDVLLPAVASDGFDSAHPDVTVLFFFVLVWLSLYGAVKQSSHACLLRIFMPSEGLFL